MSQFFSTPIGRRAMLALGAQGAMSLCTALGVGTALSLFGSLTGCYRAPGTARDQLIFFSEEKELQFGLSAILAACDYGILIRENTVTNQVASPTKFAEYLASGLPVIISPNLGDYSAFVETHHCGIKFNGEMPVIGKPDSATKTSMKQLALQNFTKESYKENYKYLLQQME